MTVTISVRDIGPIRSASFELRPLTVFVGPNNSGKSVLATIAYAALAKQRFAGASDSLRGDLPLQHIYVTERGVHLEVGGFAMSPVATPAAGPAPDETGPDQTTAAFSEVLLRSYGDQVLDRASRCLGADLADLRRFRGEAGTRVAASVTVTNGTPSWRVRLPVGKRRAIRADGPSADQLAATLSESERSALDSAEGNNAVVLAWLTAAHLFDEFPRRARYLPASRSGLLQNLRLLAGAIIRESDPDGRRDSGVVRDFLAEFVAISPDSVGDFADHAAALEQRVLRGSVRLTDLGALVPDVRYRPDGASLPLYRTSSMVSEIAPVVLYLRHLLRVDDLLIIEEPEAHLHPGWQAEFARVLASLVNAGLRILLTTHSEFFLHQLNNLIAASGVSAAAADRLGIPGSERIAPEQVAAYIFQDAGPDGGTTVKELPVTAADGIAEESVIGVAEALYDQSTELDRARQT